MCIYFMKNIYSVNFMIKRQVTESQHVCHHQSLVFQQCNFSMTCLKKQDRIIWQFVTIHPANVKNPDN